MKKLISIVLPCFNEEENIPILYTRICSVIDGMEKYSFELIFIDNCSKDKSVNIIEKLAAQDKRVKAIVNVTNFGHIRSPYYALIQATGDAVIGMSTDLQDPPELIPEFIKQWEDGFRVVAGVKSSSKESKLMYFMRSIYYKIIRKISSAEQIEHFTGFGLYDKRVIAILREIDDPLPYMRGIIAELGFPIARVEFIQPQRIHGETKNNLYTLCDMAILGITSQSKIPLRFLTLTGFALSFVSLLISVLFIVLKLLMWNSFPLGMAPILCGMFFFASVQLFFMGLLGEYLMLIYSKTTNRPLVVEERRINF